MDYNYSEFDQRLQSLRIKISDFYSKKIFIDQISLDRRGDIEFDKIIYANQYYIIFSNNNLLGICDYFGNTLIDCIYANIKPILNFIFIVSDSYGFCGLISLYSDVIIKLDYSQIEILDNGLLVVYKKAPYNEQKFCALFTIFGKQLTSFDYHYIEKFTDNLFIAWSEIPEIINPLGEIIIPRKYDYVELNSDYIKVEITSEYGNSMYGLYSLSGKEIIPCEYNFIEIKDDYILVGNGYGEKPNYLGVYNFLGKCIIPCICERIEYSEVTQIFTSKLPNKETKYQVNNHGDFLLNVDGNILRFSNILFPTLTEDGFIIAVGLTQSYLGYYSWGLLSLNGAPILPFNYKGIKRLSPNIYYTKEPYEIYEINRDDNFVRPIFLDLASISPCIMYRYGKRDYISNDVSIIVKDKKSGYKALITNDGKQITDFVMSFIHLNRRDFVSLKSSNSREGFYSITFKSISSISYDSLEFNPYTDIDNNQYHSSHIWAKDDPTEICAIVSNKSNGESLFGASNSFGEVVLPIIFDKIAFKNNGVYVEKNGTAWLYSCDGKNCTQTGLIKESPHFPIDNGDNDLGDDDEMRYIIENGGDWVLDS